VTADALLTQRKIADYLVIRRQAHYHFTVKGNQRRLLDDITLLFQDRGQPDYTECSPPDHGRIEIRKIWVSSELNDYLDFPHVGQVFVIGIIKSKKVASVAQKMRELNRNIRLVFDYLRMTKNTCRSIP